MIYLKNSKKKKHALYVYNLLHVIYSLSSSLCAKVQTKLFICKIVKHIFLWQFLSWTRVQKSTYKSILYNILLLWYKRNLICVNTQPEAVVLHSNRGSLLPRLNNKCLIVAKRGSSWIWLQGTVGSKPVFHHLYLAK